MRDLVFSNESWDEFEHWLKHDPKVVERILILLEECRRNPFKGIGKPEPLKNNLSGCWSRRITQRDRLVYQVSSEAITVIQLRYHY